MSKKGDKEPDKVTHDTFSALWPGFGPLIHVVTIHKDDATYTGYGYSEEEANKEAGEKYSKGDKDKK